MFFPYVNVSLFVWLNLRWCYDRVVIQHLVSNTIKSIFPLEEFDEWILPISLLLLSAFTTSEYYDQVEGEVDFKKKV